MRLTSNLVGALLSLAVGVGIAAVCYGISRAALLRHPERYGLADIARRLLQVGYLVALYFLGAYTPWDPLWLVVGGGLGITLPMFWFTYRLVKLNDSLDRKEESSDG